MKRAARAFIEAVLPNIVLPEDAHGWAQIVFGDLPPLAADGRAAGAQRRVRLFFGAAAMPRRRSGNDLPAIVAAVKAATGKNGRGAVQAAAARAHRPHARAGARAAAEGHAARQGARAARPLCRLKIALRTDMIRIHNSLTGEKEELKPIVPGHIGMYVVRHHGLRLHATSGMRARSSAFDMVRRYLRHRGFEVNVRPQHHRHRRQDHQARGRAGRDASSSSPAYYIEAMHEDCDALGMLRPDHEPRATQYVPADHRDDRAAHRRRAMPTSPTNGDVMYSVAQVRRLTASSPARSSRTCARARAWKWTRASAIRSISCCGSARSPASRRGIRPGARAGPAGTSSARRCPTQLLGTHFDIHGGGLDLKFPHHENEIAQTCARDRRRRS